MASTITPATLNVTVREQITMNGTDYGATTRYSADSITEVSRRIITTNGTASTEIIRFQPSASAGQYINTDVRYVRITNLDDTNHATLRFLGSGTTDYAFRLDPETSHVLMTSQASGSATGPSGSVNTGLTSYADIRGVVLTNLRRISAIDSGSAVSLELFVASE
jgi:uncharacterized protein YheU (UPF0270 family)